MKLTRLNELIREGETIKGSWELDENHALTYRVRGKEEEVKLKGTIISAEPGTLVAAVTEKQTSGTIVTSTVQLTGTWKVDPKNRIVFEVEKENGKKDKLTFNARL